MTEYAELVVALAQEEQLDAVMLQPYRAAALEWSAVGERERALHYAELACEYGITSFGKQNGLVRDMQNLITHSDQHWSWRLRLSDAETRHGIDLQQVLLTPGTEGLVNELDYKKHH